MKKVIAMLLVLTMAVGFTACGTNKGADSTTTAPQMEMPESALEILEKTWAAYGSEKFFAMGGDMNQLVENGPGKYSLEDEGITATLLVPADQVANIDEAASLVHGMMLNNFTCGAFHVTGDAEAFAKVMRDTIAANPWICGTPEKLVVAVIGEYVVSFFGIDDAVSPFETALKAEYPGADIKYSEAIAG